MIEQTGEVVTVRGKRTPAYPWCFGFSRARLLAWCPWRASKPVVSPVNRILRLRGASRLRECGLSFAPRGRLAATTPCILPCRVHAKPKSSECGPCSTPMPPAPTSARARSMSPSLSTSTNARYAVSTLSRRTSNNWSSGSRNAASRRWRWRPSVYWSPLAELLEAAGIEECLVNPRHVKNEPGRKTDVVDCQWLQYLHAVGLLRAAFRPPAQVTGSAGALAASRRAGAAQCLARSAHAQGARSNEPSDPSRDRGYHRQKRHG